ncbi:MAG: hypothetical protein ABI467_21610 [Kofleriaceae bacterium]
MTEHLDEIALEHTSLGALIASSSRFGLNEVVCDHECARALGRTPASDADYTHERILVVHDGARVPAEVLGNALRAEAVVVEIADSGARGVPPPQDYDAVVLVAWRGARASTRAAEAYMREHHEALREVPTWLVAVSRDHNRVQRWSETGWRPAHVGSFVMPSGWTRWFGAPLEQELASQAAGIARAIAGELPAPIGG